MTPDRYTPYEQSHPNYVAAVRQALRAGEANQRRNDRADYALQVCGGDKGRALAMLLEGK